MDKVERWIESAVEWPNFFIIATENSKNRTIRIFGLLFTLIWYVPAMFLSLIVIGILSFIGLIKIAWIGDN